MKALVHFLSRDCKRAGRVSLFNKANVSQRNMKWELRVLSIEFMCKY